MASPHSLSVDLTCTEGYCDNKLIKKSLSSVLSVCKLKKRVRTKSSECANSSCDALFYRILQLWADFFWMVFQRPNPKLSKYFLSVSFSILPQYLQSGTPVAYFSMMVFILESK